LDNGINREKDKDMGFLFGKMDQNIKDFGKMIKLMEKEDLFIVMDNTMKEIG